MSQENVNRFIEAARQDTALQQKLGAAASPAELGRLAVEAGSSRGFDFTADEFLSVLGPQPGADGGELSDGQLESVAGGFGWFAGAFLRSLASQPIPPGEGGESAPPVPPRGGSTR
jgi:predicted ribosomally synthesized peptide with nif11-like leader